MESHDERAADQDRMERIREATSGLTRHLNGVRILKTTVSVIDGDPTMDFDLDNGESLTVGIVLRATGKTADLLEMAGAEFERGR